MKKKVFVACLLLALLLTGTAGAQPGDSTASQWVTVSVGPIKAIAVDGRPVVIDVVTAEAGRKPEVVVDGGTYSVTTNVEGLDIHGHLSGSLPEGIRLEIKLDAPENARSGGWHRLSEIPTTLVAGVGPVAQNSLGIQYKLIVDPRVQSVFQQSVEVVLTLVGP